MSAFEYWLKFGLEEDGTDQAPLDDLDDQDSEPVRIPIPAACSDEHASQLALKAIQAHLAQAPQYDISAPSLTRMQKGKINAAIEPTWSEVVHLLNDLQKARRKTVKLRQMLRRLRRKLASR